MSITSASPCGTWISAHALLRCSLLPVIKRGAPPVPLPYRAAGSTCRDHPAHDERFTVRAPIEERGEGLHHLALSSSNVAAQVEKLRGLGVARRPRASRRLHLSTWRTCVRKHRRDYRGAGACGRPTRPRGQHADHPNRPRGAPRFEPRERCHRAHGRMVWRPHQAYVRRSGTPSPSCVPDEQLHRTRRARFYRGRIAGLAFEVKRIDELAASLSEQVD